MTYLKDNCGVPPKAKPCLSCRTPFPSCDADSCSDLDDWEISQAKAGFPVVKTVDPARLWTPEEIRHGRFKEVTT